MDNIQQYNQNQFEEIQELELERIIKDRENTKDFHKKDKKEAVDKTFNTLEYKRSWFMYVYCISGLCIF